MNKHTKESIKEGKMREMHAGDVSKTSLNTTVGELIETISSIALQAGKTEKEGYKLAAKTLEKILKEDKKLKIIDNW